MNLLNVSLAIHLFPVCCHLQSLSSESSFLPSIYLLRFNLGQMSIFRHNAKKLPKTK